MCARFERQLPRQLRRKHGATIVMGNSVSSAFGSLGSIFSDFDPQGFIPDWEPEVLPNLARRVIVVHEPVTGWTCSAALPDDTTALQDSQPRENDLEDQSNKVHEVELSASSKSLKQVVRFCLRDYVHLRFWQNHERLLPLIFEVFVDEKPIGGSKKTEHPKTGRLYYNPKDFRLRAVATRTPDWITLRTPVRASQWVVTLREINSADREKKKRFAC